MTTAVDAALERLPRQLSLLGLWLLVINGMIGAAIFGVPAEVARLAGAFSPWVFIICAALIAPIALCFAQLATYFRGTGGPVLYAASAFGPMIGFQAGWALYVGRLTAFAANLNLIVSSLGYFWSGASSAAWRIALMFLICASLTFVNVLGARDAMRSLGTLTVLKLMALLTLLSAGVPHLHLSTLLLKSADIPTTSDLGSAIFLAIYAYTGFESGSVVAGEAREPQRDLPRALLLALVVCSLVYALIQAVAVTALPSVAASSRPLLDVAAVLMGPLGGLLMAAGLVASIGGNLFASMFSVPRITYRLAVDGRLPRCFGAVHSRYQTPVWSIVIFGVLCFLLAASGSFRWLAGLSVLTRMPVYLFCIGAIPTLRKRFGTPSGAVRMSINNVVIALGALVCVGLMTQVTGMAYLMGAALLGVGTVLYIAAHATSRKR